MISKEKYLNKRYPFIETMTQIVNNSSVFQRICPASISGRHGEAQWCNTSPQALMH